MFVSDRIVFLELQKTGCTHIRKLLKDLVGGELVDKHDQASPRLFRNDRFFLGSIRDPWDWYVSKWAFGCDGKGAVFNNVTKEGLRIRGRGWKAHPYLRLIDLLESRPNRHAQEWRRTYQDANDAGAFRAWLHMLHDPDYWPDIGEGYRQCALSQFAGLLTYRYMKLFTCKRGELRELRAVATPAQLAEHESKRCFIDYFVRNEELEASLLEALRLAKVPVSQEAIADIMSRPKTNTSSKKHGASYYYDDETEKLVAERERFIIGKFGYRAPSAKAAAAAESPGYRGGQGTASIHSGAFVGQYSPGFG
ncbi:MAG TPA: hypothetical protein VFH59_15715 [Frateuria sp.]|uniref:hypothetical protein n=1 Tax=Frateuria sp. TaxID=2211372 RepID=UPI002D7EF945|nr:hypothetical protein [Frateuria sp.]HET6806881.1 hypothetical protein [Frateuria sp.]